MPAFYIVVKMKNVCLSYAPKYEVRPLHYDSEYEVVNVFPDLKAAAKLANELNEKGK
jgi:hypothetical protein